MLNLVVYLCPPIAIACGFVALVSVVRFIRQLNHDIRQSAPRGTPRDIP